MIVRAQPKTVAGPVPARAPVERSTKMLFCSQTAPRIATAILSLFLFIGVFAQRSVATSIQYDFDHEFSSGTPPAGPAPWLRAVFTDTAVNTVQLTMSTVNLSGSEFVSGWYFNLNPAFSTANLSIIQSSSSGAFTAPAISRGTDAFKADGDGKYDILFSFATAGDSTARFTTGDSLTITLTGIIGLTASDFNFMSAPAGGHGPYVAAAHVQSITGGYSGWVDPSTVTIPGDSPQVPDGFLTIVLLGMGCLAIEAARRRFSAAAV
jgi:hypothetical protein